MPIALRAAINAPVQGSAADIIQTGNAPVQGSIADIIKLAMLKLQLQLKQGKTH